MSKLKKKIRKPTRKKAKTKRTPWPWKFPRECFMSVYRNPELVKKFYFFRREPRILAEIRDHMEMEWTETVRKKPKIRRRKRKTFLC